MFIAHAAKSRTQKTSAHHLSTGPIEMNGGSGKVMFDGL